MEPSPGNSRSKRQKVDKSGRSAALERLKSLKGSKNKYEIKDVENVYEEIDEREYAKRVMERQESEWIVDEGNGYIEDGREIFDDDADEESILNSSKKSKIKGSTKVKPSKGSTKNILSMLSNMSNKSKKLSVKKGEDDAILDDLMSEINDDTIKSEKRVESSISSKDYLKSLSMNKPKLSGMANASKKTVEKSKSNQQLSISKEVDKIYEQLDLESTSKSFPESCKIKQEVVDDTQDETINDPITRDFASNVTKNFSVKVMMESEAEAEIKMPHEIKSEKNEFDDLDMADFTDDNIDVKCEDSSTVDAEDVKMELSQEPEVTEQQLTEGWETSNISVNIPCEPVNVDSSTLPLVSNTEGQKIFRFYWWDAYEEPFKQPGVVYFFGKVFVERAKSYVSCCVTVKNIQRKIFLLPREKRFDMKSGAITENPVSLVDVYKEFNDKIATAQKIMNFKSRKVLKKYAFELSDVPAESEYLEVKYPANGPKLPSDLKGETFSRVFGTNTSSLELLLLERKIKGPSWLEISNPQPAPSSSSWCKIELLCSKPEDVSVTTAPGPPPPLTVMALNIRTVVNHKNMQNEIVMLSCLIHDSFQVSKPPPNPPFKYHFCAFTRPKDLAWPYDLEKSLNNYNGTQVYRHETERSLISFFLTKLFVIDPDLIVGHDLYGFTIDTLVYRLDYLKVANWSKIGRLKRSIIPNAKGRQIEKNLLCGRLVCDLNLSAKELIRARSYDLDTLCKQVLHIKENAREDYTMEELVQKFDNSKNLISLINATMQDTNYILRLMYELNVMPLALQITNIAGNVMSRTLLGGRSERNEFLLLHAFTERDFIVPDKNYSKKIVQPTEDNFENFPKSGKKKPQYAGGLVLEPKKGFYDKFILLMDFNSLYPSIIQEYNICFTTVTRTDDEDAEPDIPNPNLPAGILPNEIRKLVESRRQVKSLMNAPDLKPELKMQYNIRQMALKLTANSMYGCLGFSHSRFYAKPLAALVTSRGREILKNTQNIVLRMEYDVIYGDTDSIMINTNCVDYEEVFKIGRKIKQEINKLYKHVELEVDGVFKYMLLLKKKKYAAVILSKSPSGQLIESQEYKGLDIVRRDWSQLSAEVGRHVLDQILSDLTPEERMGNIRDHLEKIAEDLRNKVVPISLLSITKQLTKNPEDYADKKSLPHLQVAMRINSRGGKKLKAGDTVSYVICDDGSNLPAAQRAYHVDELKTNQNLLIDVKYYLSQQIHPVVTRLCEPLDCLDAAFVAECLGLDANSYKRPVRTREDERADQDSYFPMPGYTQTFKNCEQFSFICMNSNCNTRIFMDGPLRDDYPALSKCRNTNCKTSPVEYLASIQNALDLAMRSYIKKYYDNWMVCEDPACPNRTRRVPMAFMSIYPVCPLCKKGVMYQEYRNADLYYQLKYFQKMFDIRKLKVLMPPYLKEAYNTLFDQVTTVIRLNDYQYIDLGQLFAFYKKDNKVNLKITEAPNRSYYIYQRRKARW